MKAGKCQPSNPFFLSLFMRDADDCDKSVCSHICILLYKNHTHCCVRSLYSVFHCADGHYLSFLSFNVAVNSFICLDHHYVCCNKNIESESWNRRFILLHHFFSGALSVCVLWEGARRSACKYNMSTEIRREDNSGWRFARLILTDINETGELVLIVDSVCARGMHAAIHIRFKITIRAASEWCGSNVCFESTCMESAEKKCSKKWANTRNICFHETSVFVFQHHGSYGWLRCTIP